MALEQLFLISRPQKIGLFIEQRLLVKLFQNVLRDLSTLLMYTVIYFDPLDKP